MITNTKQSVKISLNFCQTRDNPKSVSEVANPAGAVKVKVHGAFSANLDRPARVRFVVIKACQHQGCLHASFDFGCRGTVFLPPGSGENVPQFDVRFDTGDEGRGLVYLPPLPENGQAFCSLPLTKTPPVFLPVQAGRESDAPASPVSCASRYNTLHLASKVVCQRGPAAPLKTPAHINPSINLLYNSLCGLTKATNCDTIRA